MACSFADKDAKWAFVMRVVRESIKEIDGGNRSVTQQTFLGPEGLGHLAERRQLYHGEIAQRLLKNGDTCRLRTLTPASFRAPALVIVRDVSTLVMNDI